MSDRTTKTIDPPEGAASAAPPAYPFDPVLFTAIAALVVLGIVMAYSASAIYAAQKYHDAAYFLERDLVYATLGAVAPSAGFWHRRDPRARHAAHAVRGGNQDLVHRDRAARGGARGVEGRHRHAVAAAPHVGVPRSVAVPPRRGLSDHRVADQRR